MKRILYFVIVISLVISLISCTSQTELALCSDEQINSLLQEFNIQTQSFKYINGDCTGWANSKKAEIYIEDIKYSLAAIHRSAPAGGGEEFCFTTEKQDDPLFDTARNQICDEIIQWGLEQEYATCKKGNYDISEKDRKSIHLKFGSSNAGTYFSQVAEECSNVILPH